MYSFSHLVQRTSAAYARMRKALATRAAASTASSLSSCAKEEISPTTMAPAESPSMAGSLMMKTLSWSTQLQVSSYSWGARWRVQWCLWMKFTFCVYWQLLLPVNRKYLFRSLLCLQVSCLWPTRDQTVMAPSSSSPRTKQTGWMENMWCLERWWRAWMCSVQWR